MENVTLAVRLMGFSLRSHSKDGWVQTEVWLNRGPSQGTGSNVWDQLKQGNQYVLSLEFSAILFDNPMYIIEVNVMYSYVMTFLRAMRCMVLYEHDILPDVINVC